MQKPPSSPSRTTGRRLGLLGCACLVLGGALGCTAPALQSLKPGWPASTSAADEQVRQAALKDPFPNAGPRGY